MVKDDGNGTPGFVQLGSPEVVFEPLSCGSRAGSFLPAGDSALALPSPWGWDAGKPGQEGQRPLPNLGFGGGRGDPLKKIQHKQIPLNTIWPHMNCTLG